MQQEILTTTEANFNELFNETLLWEKKLDFIKKEQNYLIEQLKSHFLCISNDVEFKKLKLYINGINKEIEIINELINSIIDHKNNLSLLKIGVLLKNEAIYRKEHQSLLQAYKSYRLNFILISKKATELLLKIIYSKIK